MPLHRSLTGVNFFMHVWQRDGTIPTSDGRVSGGVRFGYNVWAWECVHCGARVGSPTTPSPDMRLVLDFDGEVMVKAENCYDVIVAKVMHR